jgi:predicted metalloprotease with PDZ domain
VHRDLVQQAYRLYGSHHYRHYDFLLGLTDEFGRIGLEHHQSSENSQPVNYFTEWSKTEPGRDLLSHEYTHSWDGKFRRPADLSTPNFNVPMQDSLLWVYEGQTQYWGKVLAARSGLMSLAMVRDDIAATAATYEHRLGRSWRPLQDTTNDPIINQRRPLGWLSWQRSEDYYSEGELVWLDVDTRIRELSGDQRSLNDFARAFFGVADGEIGPRTYTFEDVVATLKQVQPYDWATFLRNKLDGYAAGAPLDGLARGGWKLVYTEKPTDYFKGVEELRKVTDLSYSIGLVLDKDSKISAVQWDSPAFKAGLTVGSTLVALNGRSFKTDALKTAITEARTGKDPIELLVKNGDRYSTVKIDYHGGLRYPRLERIEGTPDRLGAILQALP